MSTNSLRADFMFDFAVAVCEGAFPETKSSLITDYIIAYFQNKGVVCSVAISEFSYTYSIRIVFGDNSKDLCFSVGIKQHDDKTSFYFTDNELAQIQIDKVSSWIMTQDTYSADMLDAEFLGRNRFNQICPVAPLHTFKKNNYLEITFPFYLNNISSPTVVSFTLKEEPKRRVHTLVCVILNKIQNVVSKDIVGQLKECPIEVLVSHENELKELDHVIERFSVSELFEVSTIVESGILRICRNDKSVSDDVVVDDTTLPWTAAYQHEVYPELPKVADHEHVLPGSRRAYADLRTVEERMIVEAMLAVDKIGAHPLLTNTVMYLEQAQKALADWIENTPST